MVLDSFLICLSKGKTPCFEFRHWMFSLRRYTLMKENQENHIFIYFNSLYENWTYQINFILSNTMKIKTLNLNNSTPSIATSHFSKAINKQIKSINLFFIFYFFPSIWAFPVVAVQVEDYTRILAVCLWAYYCEEPIEAQHHQTTIVPTHEPQETSGFLLTSQTA